MASSVVNKNPNLLGGAYRMDPYHKNEVQADAFICMKKFNQVNVMRDGFSFASQRNYNNYRNIDPEDAEEIQRFFDKKFAYRPSESQWVLPEVDRMFASERWELEDMMKMKEELNSVKNKLNHFDLDSWHRHTKAMNKAGNVIRTLKNDINAEFVTQAWCKFYEICSTYNFVCETAQEENYLNSVHICEAPGAFITSLNHYLKSNCPDIEWKWVATTLNPHYEGNPLPKMINDDRFVLNTLDHWVFGEDYTGNLMEMENLRHLARKSKEMGAVLMITADGSIDCLNDPGEQESTVYQLFFCEVVAALHILSRGGNFVVKMFTMYEAETICLMYLLVCCFESVNVYKPATSKEGNSENYVVCLNYKGIDDLKPWLKKLLSRYSSAPSKETMFHLEDIPKDFLEQHRECAEKFKNYQVEVIERNIWVYNSPNNQQSLKKMKRLSFLVSDEYINRYGLKQLKPGCEIVGESILRTMVMPNVDSKESVGSFNDLQEKQKVRGVERLKILAEDMKRIDIRWSFEDEIKWLEFQNYSNEFKIVTGKSVTSVHCSKFCLGKVLTMRNEIRNLAQELGYVSSKPDATDEDAQLYSTELSGKIEHIIKKFDPKLLNLKVLNYQEKLWVSLESGRNEDFERRAFNDIMDLIDMLWREESFILQGYPMLTQFTAGVIFMIGHLFEKIGFVRPVGQDFAVIFYKYCSWNFKMKNFLGYLDEEIQTLEDGKSVLAVIPLAEIVRDKNEFYSTVTAVNSLCVQEQNRDSIIRLKMHASLVDNPPAMKILNE